MKLFQRIPFHELTWWIAQGWRLASTKLTPYGADGLELCVVREWVADDCRTPEGEF